MGVPLGQICERGLCENNASIKTEKGMYICRECNIKDQTYDMRKIIIDPHNASREEYGDLIRYLDDSCWDYKFIKLKGESDGTENTKVD